MIARWCGTPLYRVTFVHACAMKKAVCLSMIMMCALVATAEPRPKDDGDTCHALTPHAPSQSVTACEAASPSRTVWVNCVGQKLHAEPIALEETTQTVTFSLPNGKEVRHPLRLFPEAEQLRLRLALGEVPIPETLLTQWDLTTNHLRRTRALMELGRTTEAEGEERMRHLRTALLNAIEKLPELTPEYREALRRRAEAL